MEEELKGQIKELKKILYETEREKSISFATSLGKADLSGYNRRVKVLNAVIEKLSE